MDNLKVCDHCLMAIESREGNQATIKHYIDSEDTETKCDWCGETADEGGFDVEKLLDSTFLMQKEII